MSTTPTTIKITSDVIHLDLITINFVTVLNETPFSGTTQNYWVARITPPDGDQRRDAYRSSPRPFQRRYIQVPSGLLRYRHDVRDFSYGFAYEFGGDRVTTDRRIPIRVYAVYLGVNGTGTVADFRVYASAELAMEAERYMAARPFTPAKPDSTLMPLPESLARRMDMLYAEMASAVNVIAVLERNLRGAGYAPLDVDKASRNGILQDAVKRGQEYGQTAWEEKFLPVVQAEAVRMGEEAARKAQAAPVTPATPVAQAPAPSPVAPPASLLDTIVAEQTPIPAPAPINRLTQESDVLAAQATRAITTKSVMRPAPAKPTRKAPAAAPGSFPRPAHIPAPAGNDLPF